MANNLKQLKIKFLNIDTYYEILREEWKPSRIITSFLSKIIAMVVVSIHKFIKDACIISASGLAFYSVLAVIPVIALSLGIARGFGFSKLLENEIRNQNFTDPAIADWVVDFANSALSNAKGGVVTGVGIAVLVWSVVRTFNSTEITMNSIWGISKKRGFVKRFTDYTSMLFIAPLFVILISGANVFLSSSLKGVMTGGGILAYAGSAVSILLSLVPYLLVWIFFIFLYKFMPAAPVKFKDALVAGVLAGTVFQLVQWFYIKFQVGVTSYNAIYGSLAALPLFLVWMRLSWSIILWGTELCYVMRNQKVLYSDKVYENMSFSRRIDIAINILNFIADEFLIKNGVLTLEILTEKLQLSTNKLRIVLQLLIEKKILLEFKDESEVYYYPAIDLHKLSVSDLITKFSDIEFDENKELNMVVGDDKDYNWKNRFINTINNEFSNNKFSKNI